MGFTVERERRMVAVTSELCLVDQPHVRKEYRIKRENRLEQYANGIHNPVNEDHSKSADANRETDVSLDLLRLIKLLII